MTKITNEQIIEEFITNGDFTVEYQPYLPQDLVVNLKLRYAIEDATKLKAKLLELFPDDEVTLENTSELQEEIQSLFDDVDQAEFDFDESNGIICDDASVE